MVELEILEHKPLLQKVVGVAVMKIEEYVRRKSKDAGGFHFEDAIAREHQERKLQLQAFDKRLGSLPQHGKMDLTSDEINLVRSAFELYLNELTSAYELKGVRDLKTEIGLIKKILENENLVSAKSFMYLKYLSSCYIEKPESNQLKAKARAVDAEIFNKAYFALDYLRLMTKVGFKPVFKGGTCVQLFLPSELQRFSIDLDIACNSEEDVEDAIAALETNNLYQFEYSRWPDKPDKNMPFTRYTVTLPTKIEFYLDVLLKEPRYETQFTQLKTSYFESDVMVRTPTIDSLIGDKLTTLGPHTVGRKLSEKKGAIEYLKQVYDLSKLLGMIESEKKMFSAYKLTVEDQIEFRKGKKLSFDSAIEDLHYSAKMLTMTGQDTSKLSDEKLEKHIQLIKNGTNGIGTFLTKETTFAENDVRATGGLIELAVEILKANISGDKFGFKKKRKLAEANYTDEVYINKAVAFLKEVETQIEWKRLINLTPLSIAYWYEAHNEA